MVDTHCHILPGLDDGAQSFDDSVALARMAAADGIRTIIATPHLDHRYAYPEPDRIRDLTAQVNERLRAEGVPVLVMPGAEVRTAPELLGALQAGRVMTLGDQGRYVLCELPTSGEAVYVGELFFRLQVAGYSPILAHAERVDQFRRDPRLLHNLHDRNVRLQVNAESLAGKGGRVLRNFALKLAKEGLIDLLATDAHNITTRPPLLTVAQRNLRGQPGLFERLTQTNPQSLLTPPPAR